MEFNPIGVVNSPYKLKNGSPHQGRFSNELSKIRIFDSYIEALDGIERCQYLIVLYWFDHAESVLLKVVPHGKVKKRGVFSTRAPVRPNPIGFCVVELVEIESNCLTVKWLDAMDNSPVIDIKPFWPEIDCP
jgi:tRNA (adenine37-N6)-methyltransferase